MAKIATVKVRTNWEREATDCSDCEICGDPIYGDMFRLITTTSQKIINRTDKVICESCLDLL